MSIKIYLDNCCFNRPYDDQGQVKIRIETEAKLHLQMKIEEGSLLLAWSYILDYENAANPFEIRQISINKWKKKAFETLRENEEILKRARQLTQFELKAKDGLHIACALHAKCEYFITTDDKILNKDHLIDGIKVLNPVQMLNVMEEE